MPLYHAPMKAHLLKPHELMMLEYGQPLVPPPAFTFLAGECGAAERACRAIGDTHANRHP